MRETTTPAHRGRDCPDQASHGPVAGLPTTMRIVVVCCIVVGRGLCRTLRAAIGSVQSDHTFSTRDLKILSFALYLVSSFFFFTLPLDFLWIEELRGKLATGAAEGQLKAMKLDTARWRRIEVMSLTMYTELVRRVRLWRWRRWRVTSAYGWEKLGPTRRLRRSVPQLFNLCVYVDQFCLVFRAQRGRTDNTADADRCIPGRRKCSDLRQKLY